MTDKPFTLPASWAAEQYPTHWSFAHEVACAREDYDFRVEFTDGVPDSEQVAVIGLLEAAPRLLAALIAVKDAGYLEGGYQPTIDMVDAAIAEATGRAS